MKDGWCMLTKQHAPLASHPTCFFKHHQYIYLRLSYSYNNFCVGDVILFRPGTMYHFTLCDYLMLFYFLPEPRFLYLHCMCFCRAGTVFGRPQITAIRRTTPRRSGSVASPAMVEPPLICLAMNMVKSVIFFLCANQCKFCQKINFILNRF